MATKAEAAAQAEKHPSEGLNIYQIIDRISNEAGALAPEAKGGVPFAFRGIDGTVAHLSALLRKYGVVVVPTVIERTTDTVPNAGKILARTTLLTTFEFFAPDGTSLIATTAGEATDFADRSTAQAQSVAFRVALLQTFFLPTHTKEPEETGQDVVEQQKAYVPPAESTTEDPIKKGREAIKALAGRKGIDYLELAREKEFPPDWATKLNELKRFYKVLEAEPAFNPETGEVTE